MDSLSFLICLILCWIDYTGKRITIFTVVSHVSYSHTDSYFLLFSDGLHQCHFESQPCRVSDDHPDTSSRNCLCHRHTTDRITHDNVLANKHALFLSNSDCVCRNTCFNVAYDVTASDRVSLLYCHILRDSVTHCNIHCHRYVLFNAHQSKRVVHDNCFNCPLRHTDYCD